MENHAQETNTILMHFRSNICPLKVVSVLTAMTQLQFSLAKFVAFELIKSCMLVKPIFIF